MKISKVLLRWYKSFNTNYMGYDDRRAGVVIRPWNLLGRHTTEQTDFPFIEIPLEEDITSIVGANESGKSHLLSAISKVLTGHGVPDSNLDGRPFSQTDLCHFTQPRSKNAEDWPNIGLQFKATSTAELTQLGEAIGNKSLARQPTDEGFCVTLVLAPDHGDAQGYLYLGDDEEPVELDAEKLNNVRRCLPRIEFIQSDLAISDQVSIASLLAAYGQKDLPQPVSFDFKAAQRAAEFLTDLALPQKENTLSQEQVAEIRTLQGGISGSRISGTLEAELEAQLFRDILGISAETLRFVASLDIGDRTHADGLAAKWNDEIEEKLNLSHYWQQDDSFALRVDYKQGMIYFEITDKTGATYTFRERSSGLRYFLSYYIQAKALECTSRANNALVLMDEPDSFLSILGQRNLLAVFESLVRAETSSQSTQLVYTTHSPFLINRNFPRRIRLVRKGDAEEGTQLADQAMLRRYEPVRSALGIDCAQTLFMGATNVVLEGPADQYLLSELIRLFVRADNANELLDLNSVILVSAESAPGVEKLLAASQWGDEPIPATVVLLDSDQGGRESRDRITGKARKCKKLIEDAFVLQVSDLLGTRIADHEIVTTEDIIPINLYRQAVIRFIDRWYPELPKEKKQQIQAELNAKEYGSGGLVESTRGVFDHYVHEKAKEYDKFGVFQEVVQVVHEALSDEGNLYDLKDRLWTVCEHLRRAIASSQQAARKSSGKQAVQRVIDDFFIVHKEASSVFAIQLLLERIQRDAELLGQDAESLNAALGRWLLELKKLRAAGHRRIEADEWKRWKRIIQRIRKNPLKVEFDEADQMLGSENIETSHPDTTAGSTQATEAASKPESGVNAEATVS